MDELKAQTPCAGMLPLRIGGVELSEADARRMTLLAPFKGREAALSDALKRAHGAGFPAPGRVIGAGGVRVQWFGRAAAILIGPVPDAALAEHAALSDQSDAWAIVRLTGAGAADVLARLTPLDLRESRFAAGATARTDLRHMQAAITRLEGGAFEIMVFRSMARTLVHDLRIAMEGVAARAGG